MFKKILEAILDVIYPPKEPGEGIEIFNNVFDGGGWMDVPAIDRAIIITDAAVNIFPTLEDKVHIVQNAIDLAHDLGLNEPKVAILSAMETVNPQVPSTIEAAALQTRASASTI